MGTKNLTRWFRCSLAAILLGSAGLASAAPFQISYSGRLTAADGKPLAGPVTLSVKFFHDADPVGPVLPFADVALVEGVFQIPLSLTPTQADDVFPSSDKAVFIEITDSTHQKTYPKQRFSVVPLALKVPVDGTTIQYDGSGQLTATLPKAGAGTAGLIQATSAFVDVDPSGAITAIKQAQTFTGMLAGDVTGPQANTNVGGLKGKPLVFDLTAVAVDQVLAWDVSDQNWTLISPGAGPPGSISGGIGGDIDDGTIDDNDISVTAAIAQSKILNLTTALNARVLKAGDTMTGALSLPTDGLVVGTNQLTASGGRVGIGTASPTFPLHVFTTTGNPALFETDGSTNAVVNVKNPSTTAAGGQRAVNFLDAATSAVGQISVENLNPHVPGTAAMYFQTSGTKRMAIDASGNVGIGSLIPAHKLDVNGTVRATSFISTSGTSDWNASNLGNVNRLGIGTTTPGTDLAFGGTAARQILVDRNSGAGTIGGDLSVQAGGAKSGLTDTNGGSLVLSSGIATGSGESKIEFQTAGGGGTGFGDSAPSTKMTILGNGNLGIGTTSPTSRLHIYGPSNRIRLQNTTTGTTSTDGVQIGSISDDNVNVELWNWETGYLRFATSNAERVRIDSSGNVGIGTTNPNASLNVVGTSGSFARFQRTAAGTGIDFVSIYNPDLTDGNSSFLRFQSDTTGAGAATAQNFSGIAGTFDTHDHATRSGGLAFRTTLNGTQSDSMILSKNGFLGLGMAQPSYGLSVYRSNSLGVARITQNSSATAAKAALQVVSAHATGSALDVGHFTQSSSDWIMRAYGNANRLETDEVSTSGAPVFAFGVRADGKVGIGTTAPTASLSIRSDGSGGGIVQTNGRSDGYGPFIFGYQSRNTSGSPTTTQSGDTTYSVGGFAYGASQYNLVGKIDFVADGLQTNTSSPGAVKFSTTPANSVIEVERLRINSAGHVGIGTTNPISPLHIDAGTNSNALRIEHYGIGSVNATINNNDNTTGTSHAELQLFTGGSSGGDPFLKFQISGEADWVTGLDNDDGNKFKISKNALLGTNDFLTIDSTGNVGLGTTVPSTKLHVAGAVRIVDGTQGASKVLTSAADGTASWQVPQAGGAYLLVVDEKASGTGGGAMTAGSWLTRTLNTTKADTGGNVLALGSNLVTLAAGSYRCVVDAPAFRVQQHMVRLYNVTGAAVIAYGSPERSATSAGYAQTRSILRTYFTLAVNSQLRIEHQAEIANATDGFGSPSGFSGAPETYAMLECVKM